MKTIEIRSSIDAHVKIPGSKSVSHRALIVSALAQGESLLESLLSCEDTLYTLEALQKMGIVMELEGDRVRVSGNSGKFTSFDGEKEIFLGNSGTSYRLLLSVAALGRGDYRFEGSTRMHARPIGDLVNALKGLGVKAECPERKGFPPVIIKGNGIRGGSISIPGNISSQYISSILLAAPYAERPVRIETSGPLVSRPYVDITLDVMKAFGVKVRQESENSFLIPAGQCYRSCHYPIEGDVSSASYFWGAAAITGGTAVTENIHHSTTRQGDIALLNILERMGCLVERKEKAVLVKGDMLKGVEVDMSAMPDMVPTLAVIALFAEGRTVIRNVSHLKHKESDRIGDMAMELRRLGSMVEELEDGLVIHGARRLGGAEIDPHNDHRIAMSLAMAGLKVPGIVIRDEDCVNKSFPGFWSMWDQL